MAITTDKVKCYEISSFRGGISDYSDKGISGAFKFGTNLDIRKINDSLSCGQALVEEGLHGSQSPSSSPSPSASISLSPSVSESASASTTPSLSGSDSASPSPSASKSSSPSTTESFSTSASPSPSAGLTTIFSDLIHFFVKCSDGYTYGFGNTGCIYRRDLDGFWMRVYKDTHGKIDGAAEWSSSSGKTFLYWSVGKYLNRKEIPGRSDWNDVNLTGVGKWPKQNLNDNATWHTMRECGGALVIANYNWLAMVGYDDSYTNEALDLVPGNIAKTIVERSGHTIAGTHKATETNKGINAAIDSEVPLAQVGDDGQIFYADFTNSMPVKRFPGGGKCNPGGVCNEIESPLFFDWEQTALSWIDKQAVGNLSLWGVFNADAGYGGVYTYGRRNKNHPFVLNLEYLLDVDEIGAIVNMNGTTLISYRDGSDFGVKAVDPDTKAEGTYYGLDFKAPVKKVSSITNWTIAELFMKPLPAYCYVQLWYKINKTGDFIQAKLANGDVNFTTTNGKKAVFIIQGEGEIIEPKIVLHPYLNTCPEVYRTRLYFQ
jgi:hypothetical protein